MIQRHADFHGFFIAMLVDVRKNWRVYDVLDTFSNAFLLGDHGAYPVSSHKIHPQKSQNNPNSIQ